MAPFARSHVVDDAYRQGIDVLRVLAELARAFAAVFAGAEERKRFAIARMR
jgi:hypothetical protein